MEFVSADHLQYFLGQNLYSIKIALIIISITISIYLVKKWVAGGHCYSTANLAGKTIIVTGSNTGIGKEAARDFYRRGARVILACRDLDKAARAARCIESTPNSHPEGRVVIRQLDLANFKSIQEFAKNILKTEPKIDVLVNNAGLMARKQKTVDGLDLVFQTNHLGSFLLTNLLLDRIIDSVPSRIVNVSSLVHKWGSIHWDDLNLNEDGAYDRWSAYCQSKLANILFTVELARRLKGTGVNTYVLHPGAVYTEFGRYHHEFCPKFLLYLIDILRPLFLKTATQGAQTTIYCAVSGRLANQSGLYYSDCGVTKLSKMATNEEDAKKLWDLSTKMVQLDKALNELNSSY